MVQLFKKIVKYIVYPLTFYPNPYYTCVDHGNLLQSQPFRSVLDTSIRIPILPPVQVPNYSWIDGNKY